MRVRQAFQAVAQTLASGAMLGLERLATGVVYNPLNPRYKSNPYPLYAQLRSRDPLHRSRLVGGWVLSRYDDVVEILRDSRFSADDRSFYRYERIRSRMIRESVIDPDEPYTPSMLRSDPPDHTRLRTLVNKAFTPRAVKSWRPRIEAIAHEQLDAVAPTGSMDVIRELAYPLPVTVIAELLGVPTEDREKFKHWSDEAVRGLGSASADDNRRSNAAGQALRAYFKAIVEQRRRDPRDDIVSSLVAAEEQGDRLSMDEVLATATLLLVAGNETTTNLIGNGLLALLRNPDQLKLLRDDPERIESAVEELLRYDSPVQSTSRFASENFEMNGHLIRKGEQVIPLLGSANRDPAQFSDPDRLDLARKDASRHLAFGHGVHHCLGAALARLEGQIAIGALVQRFPELRLADTPPAWGDNLILHGLKTLPVVF